MNMNIATHNLHDIMNRANQRLVGFSDIFQLLEDTGTAFSSVGYPPYNIIQEAENKYRIELAVAGFGNNDIDISLENRKLLIKGRKETDPEERNYLHKGISNRTFERSFILAQNVDISDASLTDGMLVIELDHIVPEEQQPKKIDIRTV